MVAVGVMALVAAGSYLAINAAATSSETTRRALERFERIDRAWAILEADLRNAVGRLAPIYNGPPLPAMSAEFNSDYRLTFVRGGRANPLLLPRTELARVGYRLEEDILWRDTWYDPAQIDRDEATPQKLVDGVTEMTVRLLAPSAQSVDTGPWLDEWPGNQPLMALPVAVEITLSLEDMGEVMRLFEILPGGPNSPGVIGGPGMSGGPGTGPGAGPGSGTGTGTGTGTGSGSGTDTGTGGGDANG